MHEISRLSVFNESILNYYGGSWADPPSMDFPSVQERFGEEALELHRECLSRFRISWVWKDPRTSLLLPFWRQVLGDEGLHIIAVRRKAKAVAASLLVRDGIPLERGLELYGRYWAEIEAGLQGASCAVVEYDDLLDRTRDTCESISRFLGVPFVAERANWALRKDWRHHR